MRKSRLSQNTIELLITLFIAGTPARSSAFLCGVSRKTATQWYHRFRGIITKQLTAHSPVFQGEIEVDESYFGGKKEREPPASCLPAVGRQEDIQWNTERTF